ncbi:hypothetical protein ABZ436_10260 [Micromonospora matsumotoense]|uniref:hypothetical protein n=1 Tax=Micromonospora matsumotoense TaxID=121616 RepID=UPI0033CC520A
MSRNTRVPRAEITGLYGAVLTKFSRKMFGDVAEPLEVMWRDTVAALVIEDGRVTRVYAVRNPHKLARLGEEASLSRAEPGRGGVTGSGRRWRS